MNGPHESFRELIADELDIITREAAAAVRGRGAANEEKLEFILEHILREMTDASTIAPVSLEAADGSLAAVEAWAGLASYAVARFYAPASPWPRDLAGWSTKVVERLREISEKLRRELARAVALLKPESYSVGVGFPWGISISLTWQAS